MYSDLVLASAPNLYLRVGEGSGATATDASGKGHNGTYNGTITKGVAGALYNDPDTAVTLDGSTGYISVVDHADLDLGDVGTWECWFKCAVDPGLAVVIDKGANGYNPLLYQQKLTFNKSGVATIVQSTVTFPLGQWNHYVTTKNGSAVHLYLNSADVTGTVTNATLADTASPLYIGQAVSGAVWLAASIDEIAVYPTELSARTVQAHYTNAPPFALADRRVRRNVLLRR